MDQNHSKDYIHSAGQESLRFSLELKVQCSVNKLPLDRVLNKMNIVHTLITYFYKIRFIIILLSILILQNSLFTSGFLIEIVYELLICSLCIERSVV
jgi:hypothetical protein